MRKVLPAVLSGGQVASSWPALRLAGARWNADIARRYGRKRAYLRHGLFILARHAGAYRGFEQIDWQRVGRVIFVCTGNICRSPYAAARARARGLQADSFGLGVTSPAPAPAQARVAARERGLDLSRHQSQPAASVACSSADLLVAMEPWQAQALRGLTAATRAQITLLGLWCGHPRPHLEDPFGLPDAYFATCFALVDDAVTRIAERAARAHAR